MSDVTTAQLRAWARRLILRSQPLPIDLIAELEARGVILSREEQG
jgi:hypothetical protein